MSTMLVFLLGNEPSAPIRWARTTDAQIVDSGEIDSASQIGDVADKFETSDKTVAILQGEQVAIRTMPSPPRDGQKFKTAARYLLEDELGESVEGLHIATSANGAVGLALATKISVIANWCDRFLEQGMDLDAITADFLCLPTTASGAFVLFDRGRVIAGRDGAGFAIENELAPFALSEFTDSIPAADIRAVGDQAHVITMLPVGSDYLGPADSRQLLMLFVEGFHARAPLNLLQGRFRKQRDWKSAVTMWRRAGAIAAAASIAFVILGVAQGVRANRVAQVYEESAQALHNQSFPEFADADPEKYAREILSTSGVGMGFLRISSKVAGALDEVEAVDVERIRFDAARGQYVLSLLSETDVDIEVFRRELAAHGISTEDSGGYRRAGEIWVGDMIVSAQ